VVNHVETRDDIDACHLKQKLLQIRESRDYRVLDAVLVSSHRSFMTNGIQQVGFFPFLVNRPATSGHVRHSAVSTHMRAVHVSQIHGQREACQLTGECTFRTWSRFEFIADEGDAAA